jgi:hypothetical protein
VNVTESESPGNESPATTSDGCEVSPPSPAIPSGDVNLKVKKGRAKRRPKKYVIKEDHCDIIKDTFWEAKPWILG